MKRKSAHNDNPVMLINKQGSIALHNLDKVLLTVQRREETWGLVCLLEHSDRFLGHYFPCLPLVPCSGCMSTKHVKDNNTEDKN